MQKGQPQPFMQLLSEPREGESPAEEIGVMLNRCRACGNATIELTRLANGKAKGEPLHTFVVSHDFADAVVPLPTPALEAT